MKSADDFGGHFFAAMYPRESSWGGFSGVC